MTKERMEEKRKQMDEYKELIDTQLASGANEIKPVTTERMKKCDWTPLHFVCRFRPRNHDLVKHMLEKYPQAAREKDEYCRYPLHIAVDSGASADVVKLLLDADKAIGNFPTNHNRWLPLHIALNRGCNDTIEDVVKELLDADEAGSNIQSKTAIGRLPLHIALEKKLPTGVIKLLLRKETVYERFSGKLPIHIACWK